MCEENLQPHSKSLCPHFSVLMYAETVEKFEKHMESIKQINPAVREWLKQSGPQHWAEAYIPGRRFGHLTSNISESINSEWLNDAREQPIGPMLESIRTHLMRWFDERRQIGARIPEESKVIDTVVAEMRKSMPFARRYDARHIVDKVYEALYRCEQC
jgi:hypothetical protein